jgi:DNA-binding NarL/FixJ family response regulator
MGNEIRKRKILIVDDQGLILEGLIRVINRQKDFEVCGTAGTLTAGREAAALHKPDLVLVDLLLPDGDGLELIKHLVSEHPTLQILAVSQCDETLYAERALKSGAHGYVMKNCVVSEIPKAIRTVLAGEVYVSPKVSARVLHRMVGTKSQGKKDGIANLTNREIQIFQLLGAGIESKDIAARLHLSIKTVETHRENIKFKLKLSNATELIRHATSWVNSQGSANGDFAGGLKINVRETPSS